MLTRFGETSFPNSSCLCNPSFNTQENQNSNIISKIDSSYSNPSYYPETNYSPCSNDSMDVASTAPSTPNPDYPAPSTSSIHSLKPYEDYFGRNSMHDMEISGGSVSACNSSSSFDIDITERRRAKRSRETMESYDISRF